MGIVISPVLNGVPVIDANGDPVSGGKILTKMAGTMTNAATYTDSTGSALNTNPIILDANGYAPNMIWLSDVISYRFIIQDASGVQIGPILDNLTGVVPGTIQSFPASSNLSMGGYRLTNLSVATAGTDAVSRDYGDLRYARLSAAANIDMNSYVISDLGNPTDGTCAISRTYADTRYFPASIVVSTTITTSTTLGASYNGQFVVVDSASPVTLTLDDTNPANWMCQILRKGTGTVTIQRQTTGTINGGTSGISIAAQWGIAQVVNYATGAATLVRWA